MEVLLDNVGEERVCSGYWRCCCGVLLLGCSGLGSGCFLFGKGVTVAICRSTAFRMVTSLRCSGSVSAGKRDAFFGHHVGPI